MHLQAESGRGGRGERRLGPYLLLAPAAALHRRRLPLPARCAWLYISFHSGPNGDRRPGDGFQLQLHSSDDPIFRHAVEHNSLLLISVPVVTVAGARDRVVLHEAIRGWRIYRTVVFLPYMIAIPVLGTRSSTC